ncbi:MAG: EamA family transporter RarD [Treponema sp.]|jgi:chloramphenicol-sensitive protein RarD|nr:EamA family transporter RarD [Treponema sp.]
MDRSSSAGGAFWIVLAYVLWGVLPLYWKLLAPVQPMHILSFRIVFSLLFTGIILLLRGNRAWLALFTSAGICVSVILAALAITVNWGLYIWAVNTGHAIEASLGYYINPLVSVALGLVFFRERLSVLQWAAFGMAAAGVAVMTILSGVFPWASLGLALSFGFYSLIKKKIAASSLESLGAETLAALPAAVFLLLYPPRRLEYLSGLSLPLWAGIAVCGAVTVLPLYCFARGVKLLPLSAVGFIQFINPTFVFLLGIFVFGEKFPVHNTAAFVFIWAAVILYSVSLLRGGKNV